MPLFVFLAGRKVNNARHQASKRQLGVGHRPTATAAMIPGETQEILTSAQMAACSLVVVGLQRVREREEGVIAVTTVGLCRVGRQGRDKFPIQLGFDCSSLI